MLSCLKPTITRVLAAAALALCAAPTAGAASITAELSRVGGNTWDASFSVSADPGQTVDAFSIYFDWAQVSNLMVWATSIDWDSLAIQADASLASDGYYDALALANGIAYPKALGGFIARFDWADPVGPSAFRFTINDPVSFDVLETGFVDFGTGGGGGTVPEPGTGVLLLAAMASLMFKPRVSSRLRERAW